MNEKANDRWYSGEKFGVCAAAMTAILATIMILVLTLSPKPEDGIAAIVFPPGTPHSESLKTTIQLGGSPIAFADIGAVVIAEFSKIPDHKTIWQTGAIVALNPIAGMGCNSRNIRSNTELIRSPQISYKRDVITEKKI